jgi:hypothetical protein
MALPKRMTVSVAATPHFLAYSAGPSVLVRDTCHAAPPGCVPGVVRADVAPNGEAGNGEAHWPLLSADGRYIVFSSTSSNLVDHDTNETEDVFMRDLCTGAGAGCTPVTARLSVAATGVQANAIGSNIPTWISPDGLWVLVQTTVGNLDLESGFLVRRRPFLRRRPAGPRGGGPGGWSDIENIKD